jgi:hypothetical protein
MLHSGIDRNLRLIHLKGQHDLPIKVWILLHSYYLATIKLEAPSPNSNLLDEASRPIYLIEVIGSILPSGQTQLASSSRGGKELMITEDMYILC